MISPQDRMIVEANILKKEKISLRGIVNRLEK